MWCGACVEKSCVCVMCVSVLCVYACGVVCVWCVIYTGVFGVMGIYKGGPVCVVVHTCIKITTLIAAKPRQTSPSQGV